MTAFIKSHGPRPFVPPLPTQQRRRAVDVLSRRLEDREDRALEVHQRHAAPPVDGDAVLDYERALRLVADDRCGQQTPRRVPRALEVLVSLQGHADFIPDLTRREIR